MNESETCAELIDPKLKENGWDTKANPDVKVHREYPIAPGKIKTSGVKSNPIFVDYVLAYKVDNPDGLTTFFRLGLTI